MDDLELFYKRPADRCPELESEARKAEEFDQTNPDSVARYENLSRCIAECAGSELIEPSRYGKWLFGERQRTVCSRTLSAVAARNEVALRLQNESTDTLQTP